MLKKLKLMRIVMFTNTSFSRAINSKSLYHPDAVHVSSFHLQYLHSMVPVLHFFRPSFIFSYHLLPPRFTVPDFHSTCYQVPLSFLIMLSSNNNDNIVEMQNWERSYIWIFLKQTKFWLLLHISDRFYTRRNSVCFKIFKNDRNL